MKKNAEGFTRIAREVFAPIYPVIADQVLAWSGIRDGLGLDLGSGPGLLSVALARKSDLSVIALDAEPAMATIAQETATREGFADRVIPVIGDVHRMPIRDNTASLIVSRGSIFFWEDRVQAFREIERILRPGGFAFVGGSFGTATLRDKIFAEMRRRNPNWDRDVARRSGRVPPDTLRRELAASGVACSRIREEEAGMWVEIQKRPGLR